MPYHLRERLSVHPAAHRPARTRFKSDATRLKERAQFLHNANDYSFDRRGAELKDTLPLLEARQVDEIVEEFEEASSPVPDHFVIPRRLLRCQRGGPLCP